MLPKRLWRKIRQVRASQSCQLTGRLLMKLNLLLQLWRPGRSALTTDVSLVPSDRVLVHQLRLQSREQTLAFQLSNWNSQFLLFLCSALLWACFLRALSLGTCIERPSGLIELRFKSLVLSCGWRKREIKHSSSVLKDVKKCMWLMKTSGTWFEKEMSTHHLAQIGCFQVLFEASQTIMEWNKSVCSEQFSSSLTQ